MELGKAALILNTVFGRGEWSTLSSGRFTRVEILDHFKGGWMGSRGGLDEYGEGNIWIKTDQLDVTCFIISLFTAQHV